MDFKKLLPLYIGAIIGPLGGFGMVPVIPGLAQEWSVPFQKASLAITAYMAPFIVIQIFSGSFAQLFQVRKTLLFGFSVYALGALLCGLSPGLWPLLTSRLVQGTGAGFLSPVIMASIGELVSRKHMGKAIGLLGMAYTTGVTLGPALSGIIDVHFGWPVFFHVLAGLSLLAGFLYLMSSEPASKDKKIRTNPVDILPILGSALREPGIFYLSFAAFSFFVAYMGIMTFMADHFQTMLNLSSDRVGTLLSVTGFSGIIVSPIAGFLGDRLGRKKVFLAGAAVALFTIGLMIRIPYAFSAYLLLFLVLGTGSAAAWTSLNTMAVECSAPLRQPVTSLYNAIKFSGYALSPVLLSFLYVPFSLTAVQFGCMGSIFIAACLAIRYKKIRALNTM